MRSTGMAVDARSGETVGEGRSGNGGAMGDIEREREIARKRKRA